MFFSFLAFGVLFDEVRGAFLGVDAACAALGLFLLDDAVFNEVARPFGDPGSTVFAFIPLPPDRSLFEEVVGLFVDLVVTVAVCF